MFLVVWCGVRRYRVFIGRLAHMCPSLVLRVRRAVSGGLSEPEGWLKRPIKQALRAIKPTV